MMFVLGFVIGLLLGGGLGLFVTALCVAAKMGDDWTSCGGFAEITEITKDDNGNDRKDG